MGKSEFLKHDLLPAAMHDGYLAAYTNLWDSTDHPGQGARDNENWRARTTEDSIACGNLWLPNACYPRSTGSVSQSR
jgi:hypothetical protein